MANAKAYEEVQIPKIPDYHRDIFNNFPNITRTLTNIPDYNPLNGFARARLVQGRHVTEYPTAKTGGISE